jgi:hypothetical protein
MDKAKKTAKTLLRANRKNDISWRTMERDGYREGDIVILPGVNNTTICRFAKSKGTWQPKDIEILKRLGLHIEKQPRPKSIWDMPTDELRAALDNRQPLIATHSKAAMQEFIRACNAASKARKARAS